MTPAGLANQPKNVGKPKILGAKNHYTRTILWSIPSDEVRLQTLPSKASQTYTDSLLRQLRHCGELLAPFVIERPHTQYLQIESAPEYKNDYSAMVE